MALDNKRITRSVLVDDVGRIVQRSVQRGDLPPPWRNLAREEDELTMARPKAFLYPVGSPIVQLKHVELIVGTTRFVADNNDLCSIRVRGEIDQGSTVKIEVNGVIYDIDSEDMLLLRTSTPGLYQVEMVDDRYWTEKYSFTIMAVSGAEVENA